MEITRKRLLKIISDNDIKSLGKVFDGFGLKKDGDPPLFTSSDKELVQTVLSYASARATQRYLDEQMANELIERTAMVVNTFYFLQLIAIDKEIVNQKSRKIPQKVRDAFREMKGYDKEIAIAIENLNSNAVIPLISLLSSGKIERIDKRFNIAIFRLIYRAHWIREDKFFAYMGLCLNEPIDKKINPRLLGVMSDLSLLAAITDMLKEEDDEDEG